MSAERYPQLRGSHVTTAGTTFYLRSESATAVDLCVLDDQGRADRSSVRETRTPMHRVADDPCLWQASVAAGPGTRYGFRVHGDWNPGHGRRANPAKLLCDPYARAFDIPHDHTFPDRPELLGQLRYERDRPSPDDSAHVVPWSVVVAEAPPRSSTRPRVDAADTVIYETHVGHATRSHPAIPPRDRGTFAGLAHPAFVDHLRDLGVTTVELLPVHQFVSEPPLVRRGVANAWGYNTLGFFAPHAAYCRAGDPDGRLDEVARAVGILHDADIEVVLDVVYNHTAEGPADGPTYHLRGIDNAVYYRLHPDRSEYVDWTGCGNTVDVRHPATRELILDSLRYWAERFDVDGYRFDLAVTLARDDPDFDAGSALMEQIVNDPVVGRLKLIAEPWDLGPGGYQLGRFVSPARDHTGAAARTWAEWNDRYRNDIRDFWRGRATGVRGLADGVAGSSAVFDPSGRPPYCSVNFVTAHDGFTLRDLVSYDVKHNDANGEQNRDGSDDNRSWNTGHEGPTDDAVVNELRLRRQASLLATVLLSVGTPMIAGGDELDRTQYGNNNAYCIDDSAVWLDWSRRNDGPASVLRQLVGRLTRLRRQHTVLGGRSYLRGAGVDHAPDARWLNEQAEDMSEDQWHDQDRRVLGALLTSPATPKGPQRNLLLWFNGGPTDTTVRAAEQPLVTRWTVRIDTGDLGARVGERQSGVRPGAAIALAGFSLLALDG